MDRNQIEVFRRCYNITDEEWQSFDDALWGCEYRTWLHANPDIPTFARHAADKAREGMRTEGRFIRAGGDFHLTEMTNPYYHSRTLARVAKRVPGARWPALYR